jgi:hypothetical protein
MQNPDRPTIDPSEELQAKRPRYNERERQGLVPLINPDNMPMDANMPEPVGIPRAQVNQRMVDFERQQQQANNGEIQEEQQQAGGRLLRKSRTRRSRKRKSRRSKKSRRSRRYRR